ncbi:MAG: O-antigen ligase family protein [Candidatus Aminicenantes bacterium]|nr:O-antigen ligase family protein [Candidatus Aminicenantes bacterium]
MPAAFFFFIILSSCGVKPRFLSRLIYFLFLLLLFLILRRFPLDRLLPPIVAGVSSILFLYGIIQKYVLFPYYLKNIAPEDNFYSQAIITRIKTGRIFSLFPLPTLYAIVCAVLILFLLHYFITTAHKKSKIWWALLLAAGLFNLILTQSFGGILYLFLGILIYLLLAKILQFKYLAPVLMVLSLFLFIIIALRFSEAKEFEPVKLRFSNWKQAARMIEAAPFWGVGLGNYEAKISYYTLSSEAKSLYAHNFFLQFPAETGVIMPCILLLFLFFSRKSLKPQHPEEKTVYIAVLAVTLLYNLIDIGFYFFSAGLMAVIALSQIYRQYPQPENTHPAKKTGPRVPVMVIAALAFLSLFMIIEAISENHRRTADFSEAQKDYETAAHYYEKSLKYNPYNYNAMVKLAQIDIDTGNTAAAEPLLDKALALYPDFALANYLKSRLELDKKNLFRADYYAAVAYNKNKLDQYYRQWHHMLRQGLENLLKNLRLSRESAN